MRTLFQHQPTQLRVRVRAEPLRPHWFDTDPEHQAQVDQIWSRRMREAKRMNTNLFDGPILRLDRIFESQAQNRVVIDVSATSYKHFEAGREFSDRSPVGAKPWTQRVTPIGSQTYLMTREGQFILFRRSQKLSVAPGKLRGLGGTSDLQHDLDARGDIDLAKTAFREASEELLVPLAEIGVTTKGLNCAGLAFNPAYSMATAVYWVQTNLTAKQAGDLPIEQEHDAVIVLSRARQRAFQRTARHDDPGVAHYVRMIQADIARQSRL